MTARLTDSLCSRGKIEHARNSPTRIEEPASKWGQLRSGELECTPAVSACNLFRMIFLWDLYSQLLWNDILAKEPGGAGGASSKNRALQGGLFKSRRMSRYEFSRLKVSLESAVAEKVIAAQRGTAILAVLRGAWVRGETGLRRTNFVTMIY